MHLRTVCVQGARASNYVEVHVVCLKQELCVGRSSSRVRRHNEAEGLQYLCNGEKLRPQGAPFSIDSMRKAIVAVLKEGHDEFPTRGLPVGGLVLLACTGNKSTSRQSMAVFSSGSSLAPLLRPPFAPRGWCSSKMDMPLVQQKWTLGDRALPLERKVLDLVDPSQNPPECREQDVGFSLIVPQDQ